MPPIHPCYGAAVTIDEHPRTDIASDSPTTEDVRVAFADTWGDMGPAWNVTPSVARVHGYLLVANGEPPPPPPSGRSWP